jgi:3-oxoacyl-[acyl-carrier-protein] synthase-3
MGLWVPDEVRRNDDWPESFVRAFHDQKSRQQARDFTHIVKSTADRPYDDLFVRYALPYENDPFKGTRERRVASPDQPTVQGDATAVLRALDDAGVDPKDVNLVMSSALVPDRLAPSNGPAIQHLTGCVGAAGIGVETYCSAALSQLDLAAGLVEAGRAKYVVCVQSHQVARANDMEMPFSPIFGDASAAFVVGPVPADRGLVHLIRAGDGSLAGGVTWQFKNLPDAIWWRDAQGPVHPGSDDPAAARFIAKHVLSYAIDTIRQLCAESAVEIDTVSAIGLIQTMTWFRDAVADGLGFSPERIPSTYDRYAYVGGAGIVANLLEARRLGLLHDGARVLLYANGAGVTRYAALLNWFSRRKEGATSSSKPPPPGV